MRKLNVLSLFDGMSCGQLALARAGIKVDKYYASEIDKHAIYVTQQNFPNTIQVGGVVNLNTSDLPKIDLLIGGSPCQGFSYAGKQLNFNDDRSKLFFEYVRILRELKPKCFLLENVKMKKDYEDIITSYLGVKPIKLNSGIVSAHSRERLYWTNIPFTMPENKAIFVKDIIEQDETTLEKSLFINMEKLEYVELDEHKSKVGLNCIGGIKSDNTKLWDAKNKKVLQRNFSQGARVYSVNGKSCTLNAQGGGWGAKTGLYLINGKIRKLCLSECERLQTVPNGYLKGLSLQQGWKLLGNGWTVDVIAHIFEQLKGNPAPKTPNYQKQTQLF